MKYISNFNDIFEKNNTAEDAYEVFIRLNNEDEFDFLKMEIDELGYDYDLTPDGYPIYIFFDINTKETSHITYDEVDRIDFNFEENSILFGVYKKEFNIDNLDELLEILKKQIIPKEKPTYKPRKIDRINESNDSPIVYIFECDDESEFEILQQKLFNIGYSWITGENKNTIGLNDETDEDDETEEFPAYIFISTKRKQFFYSGINTLEYNSLSDSLIDKLKITVLYRSVGFTDYEGYINDEVFKVEDFNNKIRYLKPGFRPTYKPKKIDRINESTNLFNTIIFESKKHEETIKILETLFELGWEWNGGGKNIINFNAYPYYILATDTKKLYHILPNEEDFNISDVIDGLDGDVDEDGNYWKFTPKLFNHDDVSDVNNLFKLGYNKPTYKSKNIIR